MEELSEDNLIMYIKWQSIAWINCEIEAIKCIWLIQLQIERINIISNDNDSENWPNILCNYVSFDTHTHTQDKMGHFRSVIDVSLWFSITTKRCKTFVIRCTQPIFEYHKQFRYKLFRSGFLSSLFSSCKPPHVQNTNDIFRRYTQMESIWH